MPHIVVSSCGVCEALVPFEVEREALKERGEVKDPVAAPLEDLNLVVESCHKATVVPGEKIIRDLRFPFLERTQEVIVTGQPTGAHPLLPVGELLECRGFGERGVKNTR